jgi:hypothetical protein
MFTNRFLLLISILSLLLVSLAVASPITSDPAQSNTSQLLGPVIVPQDNAASRMDDFHQRHSAEPVSNSLTEAPIDECFDVSLSELAACREASQSPAQ